MNGTLCQPSNKQHLPSINEEKKMNVKDVTQGTEQSLRTAGYYAFTQIVVNLQTRRTLVSYFFPPQENKDEPQLSTTQQRNEEVSCWFAIFTEN